eukprot:9164058-Prorocentrum_lima.AAC.1
MACLVALAASVQTGNPEEALRQLKGCWKLLCNSKTLRMCMMPGAEYMSIEVSAGASFAPEGE